MGYLNAGAFRFTSPTSFANPAVTIARGFTDGFAGIFPGHVPVFFRAEVMGVAVALLILP